MACRGVFGRCARGEGQDGEWESCIGRRMKAHGGRVERRRVGDVEKGALMTCAAGRSRRGYWSRVLNVEGASVTDGEECDERVRRRGWVWWVL